MYALLYIEFNPHKGKIRETKNRSKAESMADFLVNLTPLILLKTPWTFLFSPFYKIERSTYDDQNTSVLLKIFFLPVKTKVTPDEPFRPAA